MTAQGGKAAPHDEMLTGGMANAGAVFRRGELVDRPAPRNAQALHDQLDALRRHGFDGAPRPVALTGEGREQLTFVPGDVGLPPFPGWVMADEALRSVGELLRRLHDASAAVPPDPAADWSRELSDPEGGTAVGAVLCHNDVCPENVVFRDGRAVALIDFDQAAPGRPVWDVAMTARYWAPMLDPDSAAALYPEGLDPVFRLRLLADSYGLSRTDRGDLPAVVEQTAAAGRAFVARRVAAGDPVYVEAMSGYGGWARWDRLQEWLADRRETFRRALLD